MIERSTMQGYYPSALAARTNSASFAALIGGAEEKSKAAPAAGESAPAQTKQAYDLVSLYEQLSMRELDTARPTYELSEGQIDDLKSRYDINNMSAGDLQKLMKELADGGIISKSDGNIAGVTEGEASFVRRPIALGLFKQETHDKFFSYSGFESGNVLDWLKESTAKNDSAIEWLKNSKEDLNDYRGGLQNISSLESYNYDANKILKVLNQLK